MPEPNTPPPADLAADLETLRRDLDLKIPPKTIDRNLLLATWNLRAFGDLSDKWVSLQGDSPRRDQGSLYSIAEIVSRFDVIAIQEVRGNIKALRHLLKRLGTGWSFLMSDVTKGKAGNDERLAFLYDTNRVSLSGLACELVMSPEALQDTAPNALKTQFARTPYAVSFYSAGKTFIMITLHVIYGDALERVPELTAVARWLSDWAREVNGWDHNLIALGDFNIDRNGDVLYQAFTSTGLSIPPGLAGLPRTVFDDPTHPNLQHFYDQIAWFTGQNGLPELSMTCTKSGHYDFVPTTLASRQMSKQDLSWHISDHYPLWVEFNVRDS